MEADKVRSKDWILTKVNECWFLNVGGKLKRLNVLKNAQDVHMEDNIIFADDLAFQLITDSDNEISLIEIDDICRNDKRYEYENIDTLPNGEGESDERINNEKKESEVEVEVCNDDISQEKKSRRNSSSSAEIKQVKDPALLNSDDVETDDNDEEEYTELGSEDIVEQESAFATSDEEIRSGLEKEDFETGSEEYVSTKDVLYQLHINDSVPGKRKVNECVGVKPKKDESATSYVATTVRAMYDFDAVHDKDLSFRKGDKLEVVKVFSQNVGWWVARHLTTGEKGFIPRNYVTKDDNSLESQDWWYNVNRKEADKQLLLPGNPTGTFLMRDAGDKVSYVLSVRVFDRKTNDACIIHYKILKLNNGKFYISPKRTFDNMLDLIFHYRNAADGMCCKLEIPCPKIRPLVQFRELEVSRESVILLNKLGSGRFGEIYTGKWHNTVDVAVKTLKQGQMTTDDFMAEAKLMHHLRHNKLVQLMAVCTKTEPIWIITELMINGALLDYLRKDEGKTLNFNALADMAGQIADGMAYLETKNCVHRDLRAANVLVGDHNEVKVTGFSLARLILNDFYKANKDSKFPVKWTAPEAALGRKYSMKSDVWSYGVLLYELITFGRIPYPDMTGQGVLNRVDKGYRMQKPTGGPVPCPDLYYEVMLKCWNKVADSRPTFADLRDYFLKIWRTDS